ncbi:MAG: SurA N-terminal domain-containing protein [Acidobacteriaceae bacterium]|nr:SurA N-terminal domain-containing protein [Acidobacteriaceae bacterium]
MNYSIQIPAAVLLGLLTLSSAQTLQPSHEPALPASLPGNSAGAPGKAVARVNGVPITEAEFEQEMKRIFPYYSQHGNAIPKEYEADVRNKALSNLIQTELAYQEAKRRHLQITPAEWQKRVAEIRKDYQTRTEFEAAIKQYFGTRAAFEAKLRHDMLLDKIFKLEVIQKANVSEAEVREEYEKNKSSYIVPEAVSFQTISKLFPKNSTTADKQEARKRIDELLPKAQAAKSYEAFGLLAEKSSDDEYRVMMGEHKVAHRGSLAPEFERALFSMKEGDISAVIESPMGYHILRLNKHAEERRLTYSDVRDDIRKSMKQERLSARNKAFQESLRKAATVQTL